jgi:hypothetical protein
MSVPSASPSLYRFSILTTAAIRMWRAWRIVLPVALINASVQAILLLPGFLPYLSAPFIVTSLLSFAVLVASLGFITVAMLEAVQGRVHFRWVVQRVRARFLPLLAWSIGLVVLVTLGFSLYVIPGFVILGLTPYLLLAVVDGRSRPLHTNFVTIGSRWGRWLVTIAVLAILCLVLWLLAALGGFFIGGPAGAFVAWLSLGIISSWFICAWSLVYRSVNP